MRAQMSFWPLPTIPTPLGAFILLALVYYVYSVTKWRARTRGLPLPPGPRRFPIIGTLLHKREPILWEEIRTLCDTYGESWLGMTRTRSLTKSRVGDVVYTPVLGTDVVILGSPRPIQAILEKHSAATSSRGQTHIAQM